jgi:selenide,water dikinase
LLVAVDPAYTAELLQELHSAGYSYARRIGRCQAGEGIAIRVVGEMPVA